MSTILGKDHGLLEQTQLSFVGLDFYADNDPQVINIQAAHGAVKSITDDPGDFEQYDQVVRTLSNNSINWFNPEASIGGLDQINHIGWFFDLPFADEQLATDPLVLDGVLYYSTSIWSATECGASGSTSMIMAHDSCSGGGAADIVFDLNGDELLSSTDTVALYDLDGSIQVSPGQVAGLVSTNTETPPAMIRGGDNDFMYAASYFADNSSSAGEGGIEPGYQPTVRKTTVRGKNLGLSFWRKLF